MKVPGFWIWLKRFRHRKGYGVHSPFAFDFITGVVYETGMYYAYRPLEQRYGGRAVSYRTRKNRRLLFRMVNYARPDRIEIRGASEAEIAWLSAAHRCPVCTVVADEPELAGGKAGFLYVDLDGTERGEQTFESWLPVASSRSVYMVKGIHASAVRRMWWKRMQQHPLTGIIFDLYDFGIVFFNRDVYKQHYIVNY